MSSAHTAATARRHVPTAVRFDMIASRSNGASGATGGGSATSPASQKSIIDGSEVAKRMAKGTLAPLAAHVESLPRSIATVIENKAASMLSLVTEIVERKTALDRFNTKVKTKSGVEELYAPSACRNKNPITGSRVVRGTDPFVKLVAAGEALQKKYQEEFRELFKTAAALEVSLRIKALKDQVSDALRCIARNFAKEEHVRTQANIVTPDCSSDFLAYQAIKEIVNLVTDEYAEGLRFIDKDDLRNYMVELMKKDSINIVDFELQANSEDREIVRKVKVRVLKLFPQMTTKVWQNINEKEVMLRVIAAQDELNKAEDQKQINEKTAAGLDASNVDPVNSQEDLVQLVTKVITSREAEARKRERKNSSAGSETQESNAGKNGRSSNRGRKRKGPQTSNSSSKKSKTQNSNSKEKQTPKNQPKKQKQNPKKSKRNGKANPQRKQSSNKHSRPAQGQGNRGGSSSAKQKQRKKKN